MFYCSYEIVRRGFFIIYVIEAQAVSPKNQNWENSNY
jgi:hypothetical protein